MMLSASYLWAQSITADGQVHTIAYTGSHQTFTIPDSVGAYDHIEFYLNGGDGGRRKVPSLCKVRGGEGATIVVRFQVGTGAGMVQPGGHIRFVVGKKGDSKTGNGVDAGGGGGGTAVLYRHPNSDNTCNAGYPSPTFSNASSCWVLLAVAGGGGGSI